MKKKIIIVLTIIIALIAIGIVYLNKQKSLSVKLFIKEDNSYRNPKFDGLTSEQIKELMIKDFNKYNEIELTPEQQKEIIKLYRKTNTKRKQDVKEAFIGMVKLEFSDGNVISMDKNNSNYAYNGEYCIRLSKGFKEYILNIVD